MKRYKRLIALAVAIAMSMVLLSPKESAAQIVPSRVKAVYETTATITSIPLIVPSIIPLTSLAAPDEYWASSIAPKADRYIISFDRAEDCTGVEECSFAFVKGELDANSTTSYHQLSAQISNENIVLDDGIPAVFSPSIEGIYTPASVYVKVGDYLYTFSIYMASQSDVLEMANSAIEVFSE